MATLDIFKSDAFSLQALTNAITNVPFTPTKIGQSGLFTSEGITTTNFSIEAVGSTLSLVPSAPRNAPGRVMGNDKRKLIPFQTVHLPQRGTVVADEVQGIRAFGTESEADTVMRVVNSKLMKMRRDLDVTIEWQRLGAIKGQVLDADGTTVLLDVLGTFGVSQQTLGMALTTDATKVVNKVVAAKRLIEDELGGLSYTGLTAYCGATFFDTLVAHPAIEKTYLNTMQAGFMREDHRDGFFFAGVFWTEYRGNVSGNAFVGADDAYLVPTGVADLFITKFAPANYLETVNTPGLPYYAKQWAMEADKGIELEAQSNPISICTRPRAVVKLTKV